MLELPILLRVRLPAEIECIELDIMLSPLRLGAVLPGLFTRSMEGRGGLARLVRSADCLGVDAAEPVAENMLFFRRGGK